MYFFIFMSRCFDYLIEKITAPFIFIKDYIDGVYVTYVEVTYGFLFELIEYIHVFCEYKYGYTFRILSEMPIWSDILLSIIFYNNYISSAISYITSYFSFFFLKSTLHFFNHLVYNFINFTLYASLITSLKFILLIACLVFVRGGIPRYRFDYLTKLGWNKFLSLVLLIFLIELFLIWIF